MHAIAVYPENRLRHEGGIDTVLLSYLLDYQAIGHHVIRHGEGVGVL